MDTINIQFLLWSVNTGKIGYYNEGRNQEVNRDFYILDEKGKASGGKADTDLTFQSPNFPATHSSASLISMLLVIPV
jgi:hypothetical protein